MVGADVLSLSDIEAALVYSVSEALCAAATAEPFSPDGCAQAAKAYKHDAFAAKLDEHVKSAERVQAALHKADRQVRGRLDSSSAAEQFIDSAGVESQLKYTPPPRAGGKGCVETPKGSVRTRQAHHMATLWTLRYAVPHFGYSACQAVQQRPNRSSYEAVAVTLANVLKQQLPPVALSIQTALQTACRLLPEAPAADNAPARKRPKRSHQAVFINP